jgi:hypothetical protein
MEVEKPANRSLSLVHHTFSYEDKEATVGLAYKYVKIDPQKTRFFFEGEAILIDPETSSFETYVTYPLMPCILGRIYDPHSGKSLVFHKYGCHGMNSLRPFYEKLGVTNAKQLNVALYSCEMDNNDFAKRKKHYGNITQAQDMNAVRDFLRDAFEIPEENIERRFFRNLQKSFETLYRKSPELAKKYVDVFATAGVTKTGEIFHTSLVAEDIFTFQDVKPPEALIKGNAKATYNGLSFNVQNNFYKNFCSATFPLVRRYNAGDKVNPNHAQYGELNFFSSEELNVPAPFLPGLFSLNWGEAGRENDIKVTNPFEK